MEKYTGKIWDVLKSKRFVSSFVIVLLTLGSTFVPQIEQHFEELSVVATAAIIALVSGYSLQEIAVLIFTGRPIPQPSDETQS